ncbi:hypothetical protein MYX78_12165, partial [Acidobacteria bacterium AH-259-G07]|nr:hypothetical protein [Acidobacteria bacterium AH-259-G07]
MFVVFQLQLFLRILHLKLTFDTFKFKYGGGCGVVLWAHWEYLGSGVMWEDSEWFVFPSLEDPEVTLISGQDPQGAETFSRGCYGGIRESYLQVFVLPNQLLTPLEI